jgi:rhamnosyltransferase
MISCKNVTAVVILYNPNDEVPENIESYRKELDRLYIIDNSAKEGNVLCTLKTLDNVHLLHQGENIGISKALNLALHQAGKEGYEWLVTFDQDTAFERGDFPRFCKDALRLHYDDKRVKQISPLHNKKHLAKKTGQTFTEKSFCMTSASMIHIPTASQIGGFDEKLFIDEIDHEFSLRLLSCEYRTFEHNTVAVEHRLGTKHHSLSHVTLYPPERIYYMVRNYLYLRRKYYTQFPSFFRTRDKYLKRFFFYQFLHGKTRFHTGLKFLQGITDYLMGNFGRRYL